MQNERRARSRQRTAALGVLLALALLLGGAVANAQAPAGTLSLEEAIARATKNSLRLAELEARGEAAAAVEQGRDAARLPTISAVGGYTRTNHVEEFFISLPGQATRALYPDVPDNYRARLDLQWPIYTGGRVDALERAARAERQALTEDLAAARADLRLEVTRAFWALVTARESELVLTRSLDSINGHVRDLRSRLEQGLIPPNDVLSAEAEQSRQRMLAIDATNMRGIAEADVRRLLGADSSEPIRPDAQLAGAGDAGGPVAQLVDQARTHRAERRGLENRADAARARIEVARSAALPQVSVIGGYDYARPNPRIFPRVDQWHDSWDVGVNVSWTLFDGGRIRADRAEATATAKAAATRIADFDRQLAFEVEQRRLELESSRAAIVAAEDGVRAAAEARRVVAERFRVGVATSTDVLDAETALLRAELDRTRALANSRLAQARLARAVGR